LRDAQHRLADQHKRYVPVVLKIAPDLDDDQIANIGDALLRHKMDGVIATNTTIRREAVTGLPHAEEAGGLSGQPVREGSTRVIRALRGLLGDAVPIIGVGGILAGEHAREKIGAGAQLVQLYTGLIYRGPGLVAECARALAR
jgi:dihydroorotate dehydrogenase